MIGKHYFIYLFWIIYWLTGQGLLAYFMKKKIYYIRHYVLVAAYFTSISLVPIIIFNGLFSETLKNINIFSVILIVFAAGMGFTVYFLTKKYVNPPEKFLKKHEYHLFLKLDYRYIISCSFELVYQQTLILMLVTILHDEGLSLIRIIIIFSLIFVPIHALMFIKDRFSGAYYTTASLFGAVVFPALILSFENGIIYSYIVHLAFYMIGGPFFWWINGERKKEKKIAGAES